ncbi:helix-turn-helix domain-containing protein [Blautia segnis]|uniref:Helix-turn-helix transcriptional regulator n=1 Tax=Blautia segnis TaxID=2763030 RepID=A0A8I0AIS6_9FIRM|nr:helix-turn-helix transcriptional regulator [Blautia segnis]MBC5651093.1 helix-turn-helix transcriptional regulator [Blautia segnis]
MFDNELCLQEIGKRIMERRKKLGLTQEALAEKGDVTTQFVSYAESGKRAMRPENLLKISSALNVSADYLLTGEIIDKDLLILSGKLQKLTPAQVRTVESIIDECITLFGSEK